MERRVVICESCVEEPNDLVRRLEYNGFQAKVVARNGRDILAAIREFRPELVLCELFLPSYDAVAVLHQLEEEGICTMMVVSSPHANSRLEERVVEAGAVSYIIRPYSVESLSSLLFSLLGVQEREERKLLAVSVYGRKILEIYKEIGMSPSSKGANYLMAAIEYALNHPGANLRGNLYAHLQERYQISSSRIERAMRHAIETTCDRGNYQAILDYFGSIIQAGRGKPTNFEFIATIANHIQFYGNCQKERYG